MLTFQETKKIKNMQGLPLTCLSTCPSDKEVTEHVVFDARNYFTESDIMLPIGYLPYWLSQNTTLSLLTSTGSMLNPPPSRGTIEVTCANLISMTL
jgi:hypothetical protein